MAMIQLNNGQITFISALSDFKELIQEAYGNQAADAFNEVAPYDSIGKDVDTVWDMIYSILDDEDNGLTEEHRKTLDNALNLLTKHV